jgi:hypothetical protein
MKLEELARMLAESMGTGAYLHERTRGIVLRAELHNHGLDNDDRTVTRLEDMIDNITAEAFRDWDEKRDMAGKGRPDMLSDHLGYPASVGDTDWHARQEAAYQRGLEDGGA